MPSYANVIVYGPFCQAVRRNDFAQHQSTRQSERDQHTGDHSPYGAICKTRPGAAGRFETHIWHLLKTAKFGVASSVASVAALWPGASKYHRSQIGLVCQFWWLRTASLHGELLEISAQLNILSVFCVPEEGALLFSLRPSSHSLITHLKRSWGWQLMYSCWNISSQQHDLKTVIF